MTTAHRPTFDPARGKEAARGPAYHSRELPAYKTLKYRKATQGAPDEQARRNMRAELLRAEARHYAKKEGREYIEDDAQSVRRAPLQIGESEAETSGVKRKSEDERPPAENDDDPEEDYEAKKRRVLEETKDIDADSSDSSEGSEEEDDDDSDEDSDEDADLQRELARIKAERAEAAAKVAAEQQKKEQDQRERDIALGNPLLNPQKQDYGVKRRWDDDVVFKNQARGTEDRGKEKRFVNDLLRSDFHRRFMDKYVR